MEELSQPLVDFHGSGLEPGILIEHPLGVSATLNPIKLLRALIRLMKTCRLVRRMQSILIAVYDEKRNIQPGGMPFGPPTQQ